MKDALIDILDANENCVEENYNNRDDLVALNKKLKDELYDCLKDVHDGIDKKELIKHTLREYFELEERDIIVIKENNIIIKLLDDQSIQEVPEEEKNTIANRYNGINEDDLVSFYNDVFMQEDNEDFFYFVAEDFVEKYLIAKRLDNKTYENSVFPTIQLIITQELISSFDHNKEFFKGFSGYIFRIHFEEVFEFISELILVRLSQADDYITNFLKYYSMSVVIVNGQRYKVPEIEANNGWKWNVSSMTPVIKIYIRAQENLERLEKELNYLETKAMEYYVSNVSPVAYNSALNKEIDNLRQDILYDAKRLDAHVATLKDDQSNTKLKEEIHSIRKDLRDFRLESELLTSKLITKDIILKYTDLRRDIDAKSRQRDREEKVLESNKESFYSIVDALSKALISKKALVK